MTDFVSSNLRSNFSNNPGRECLGSAAESASSRFNPMLVKRNKPLDIKPLLALQKLTLQSESAVFICDTFRKAQQYFRESNRNGVTGNARPFLVHELMPAHQQQYIFDCMNASRDFSIPTVSIVVFTTQALFNSLMKQVSWLSERAGIIGADDIPSPQLGKKTGNSNLLDSKATVSCICLRSGKGGRWLMMDHDMATIVRPDIIPTPEIASRLLNHTVDISGNKLAPYLALIFDVPEQWKTCSELATRSLLIFTDNMCSIGCDKPELPQRIFWSDQLGIIY